MLFVHCVVVFLVGRCSVLDTFLHWLCQRIDAATSRNPGAAAAEVGMDVAASEFKVEGQDCYDLGTWYPDAEKTPEP